MNETQKLIQKKLENKVFLVYSLKEWEKLLLSLSPYCTLYDYGGEYISGESVFEPLYLRVTEYYANGLLGTGWGTLGFTSYYQNYVKETDLDSWFNIL